MDNNNLNHLPDLKHLLHEHLLLKSFNVNRRITKPEIAKIAKSMGMDSEKIDFDDIHSIIATISSIEYSCGIVPGTKNSINKPINNSSSYQKVNQLITYSMCVLDLLAGENLSLNEKIFVLNKCITDLQTQS